MARVNHTKGGAISAFRAGTSLLAFVVLGSAAFAQTGPGEDSEDDETIIVTATKRASTVQDVPFSINAQTEEDIQRSGAVTIEDLSRNVAGLTVQNLGPGQSQVAVRGVSAGPIIRDQPGVKEQVGVYHDESVISLSLFSPDLDLFEGLVEGNINLIDGGGTGGHLKGAVNIPIAPGIAAIRVVGYHTEYAGFIDALREGGGIDEDVNDGRRTGGRIALTIEPTPGLSITPRVVYQEIRAGGFNRQEVYNLYAQP